MRRLPFPRSIAPVQYLRSLLLLLLVTAAQAEVRPSEVSRPVESDGDIEDRRHTVFELHLTGQFATLGGEDYMLMAPMLRITQPVGGNEVWAEWGMGSVQMFDFVDRAGGGAQPKKQTLSTFVLGNPHLAWLWAWRVPGRWIRAGIGVAAPAASIRIADGNDLTEELVDRVAYAALVGAHGGRNIWLWAPEAMSVIGHADINFRFQFGMTVGVGAHVAELVGIDEHEKVYEDQFNTVVQGDLDLAYEHARVRIGLLTSYATFVTGPGSQDEKDSIGVTPEVRLRIPGAVDVVARFNLNVDEPYGFSFDDDRFWGASLGVSTGTTPRIPKPKRRRRFQ